LFENLESLEALNFHTGYDALVEKILSLLTKVLKTVESPDQDISEFALDEEGDLMSEEQEGQEEQEQEEQEE